MYQTSSQCKVHATADEINNTGNYKKSFFLMYNG